MTRLFRETEGVSSSCSLAPPFQPFVLLFEAITKCMRVLRYSRMGLRVGKRAIGVVYGGVIDSINVWRSEGDEFLAVVSLLSLPATDSRLRRH